MSCPNCDSEDYERYRSPVTIPGQGIVRRHKCRGCGWIFMSIQVVVSDEEAWDLAVELDLV